MVVKKTLQPVVVILEQSLAWPSPRPYMPVCGCLDIARHSYGANCPRSVSDFATSPKLTTVCPEERRLV
jgi:hypothetical protein